MSLRLSDIRMMILCQYPLSALEYGNSYYDGDGVAKDLEEAYVWYKVAQCAGVNQVGGLVDSIGSIEFFVKFAIYYYHERLWTNIKLK